MRPNTRRVLLGAAIWLLAIAFAACGSEAPEAAEPDDITVDPAATEAWTDWATRARALAADTLRIYLSGQLLPSQAEEIQRQARALATEIRNSDQAGGPVLNLAADLELAAERLEFGITYARNAGLTVIFVEIPGFVDALTEVSQNATRILESMDA